MAVSKSKAKGSDGMSPREREFVRLRRADPAAPGWKIAQQAGFVGSEHVLKNTVQRLMKISVVHRAIFAPRSRAEELRVKSADEMSDAELGSVIKQAWLDIVRSGGASPGDRARAAAKLGETIKGFFVPLEVNTKGTITMEDIVDAMDPPQGLKDKGDEPATGGPH